MADLEEVIKAVKKQHQGTRNDAKHSIKSIKDTLGPSLKNIDGHTARLVEIFQDQFNLQKQQIAEQKDLLSQDRSGGAAVGGGVAAPPGIKQGASQAFGGLLGGIGGILGGLGGAALGGGLMLLGPGLGALSAGIASFANPVTVAGGAAILAFLGGLGGVAWLAGKGAQEIGQGFEDIGDGIDRLDDVGKKIDSDNLIAVGDGLKKFLENVGSVKSAFGAIVTFLTGDLPAIADGMDKLNTINVDNEKMKKAGEGLNVFMSAMGEGSFFGKLMGAISTKIAPDMTTLAEGFTKLSDASKTFELAKFLDMAKGMEEIHEPLYEFSKSLLPANAILEKTLPDLAKGITALNKAEVNRMVEVSDGIKAIDASAWEIVKTGFAANFVGANALKDISDGVSYLNKTDVSNTQRVADAFTTLDGPVFSMIKSGFVANFVGKNALTDLADGAKYIMENLGTEEKSKQANLAATSMNNIKSSLMGFAGSSFVSGLANAATGLLSFLTGEKSPIEQILSLAKEVGNLERVGTALDKIASALSNFANIKIDTDNIDFKKLAERLGAAIPMMEVLANGGKTGGFLGIGEFEVKKGLLSPDLKLDEMVDAIGKVNRVLGFQPAYAGAEINTASPQVAAEQRGGSNIVLPSDNRDQRQVTTINNMGGGASSAEEPGPRPNNLGPGWK